MKLILSILFIAMAPMSYAKVEGFEVTAQDGYITPFSVKDGTKKGAEIKAKRSLREHCTNSLNGRVYGGMKLEDSYCEYSCTVVACATLCFATVYGKCKY